MRVRQTPEAALTFQWHAQALALAQISHSTSDHLLPVVAPITNVTSPVENVKRSKHTPALKKTAALCCIGAVIEIADSGGHFRLCSPVPNSLRLRSNALRNIQRLPPHASLVERGVYAELCAVRE